MKPDFFLVGAQKCGTTTLWEGLRGHPHIVMTEKDSNFLLGGAWSSVAAQEKYGRASRAKRGAKLLGEASSRYTVLPDNPHTAARAHEINAGAMILYIVRDPIKRLISHHHHDYALGLVGPDINVVVKRHHSLLRNSRYATQLGAWLNHFQTGQTRIVKFEQFIGDQQASINSIYRWLGVDQFQIAEPDTAHNAASAKVIAKGRWRQIANNDTYRSRIRPLVPESLRRGLMMRLLPNAPPRPDPPTESTLHYLLRELTPEAQAIADVTSGRIFWDLERTVEQLTSAS